MGLVHVLENLAQPEKLGHLIAGAFVATLWGVLSANVSSCRSAPASSGSASSRSPRWSWSSRASPRSRPAPTRAWSPSGCARLLPADAARRRGGLTEPAGPTAARRQAARGARGAREPRALAVTYADMLTLLMVLFIVLFAMSQVDQKKYNALRDRPRRGLRRETRRS